MEAQTILEALRTTDGVKSAARRDGWIVVQAESSSRAAGLAETAREVGFRVRQRGVWLALR